MDRVPLVLLIIWFGLSPRCSGVLAKVRAPGVALFESQQVIWFEINIAPDELEQLRRMNRVYVRATLKVGTNTIKDVGVRLKGHGSFRPLDDKPSFTLKFDKFTPGEKIDGLTKLMLNNASQDTSLLSEYIAAKMFADAGVPVARVAHARVQLNTRDLGFYVLEEGMNKVFLRQHFKSPRGNLYDANARDIDQGMTQIGGEPGDQSDLAALVAAARLSPEQRAAVLPTVLDLDRFLSFLAISILGAHHDSYPLNRNNYRLYHDPATKRFVMIPHGIDGSFAKIAMPIELSPGYLLTRAIVETSAFHSQYRDRVAQLFTNAFRVEELTNRINAAARVLGQAAASEAERTGIQSRAESFRRRLIERHQRVADQLAGIDVKPLVLSLGATLKLTNWLSEVNRGGASFDQVQVEGRRALQIVTEAGDSLAAWRKRIILAPGSYHFQGSVLLKAPRVSPTSGAAIRISGRSVTPRVPADGGWTPLDFRFVVRPGEEEVQLVCECRGSNVRAWFDLDSLILKRGD